MQFLSLTTSFLLVVSCAWLLLLSHGQTLEQCSVCLVELPKAFGRGLLNGDCVWSDCGLGVGEEVNFELCGCAAEVEPLYECFDNCTPPCLETTATDFYECMQRPICILGCADDFLELREDIMEKKESFNLTNFFNLSSIDFGLDLDFDLSLPECNISQIIQTPVECLYPTFPECSVIQEEIVNPTCDTISCCPSCQDELAAAQSCVYNWISGDECDFNCGGRRQLLSEQKQEGNQQLPNLANGAVGNAMVPRLLRRMLNEGGNGLPSSLQECEEQLNVNIVENPSRAMQDYTTCLTVNSLEDNLATDLPPAGDDTSGSASRVIAFLSWFIGMAVLIVAL